VPEKEIAVRNRSSIALVTALLGCLGAWAVAAQESSTEQITDEIRVEGPRRIKHERLPFGQGEEVSLSYDVSYADLDLREAADVRELEKRIGTAASEICAQLEELFPSGDPGEDECVDRAVIAAMADARAVIDRLAAP
jgi:UrcA family protein